MMKLSVKLLLLLASYGCKHEVETISTASSPVCLEIAHEDSCQEFQLIPGPFGVEELRNDFPQFLYPSVNPNNPNEFVYLHAPSGSGIPSWTIRRHNSITHEDSYLVDSPFTTHIAMNWGSVGWIAITGGYGKIYLIREDGSMFHFLMNSGSVSDAPMDWLSSGDRFLVYGAEFGSNIPLYCITNLAGQTVDSIQISIAESCINANNDILGLNSFHENNQIFFRIKTYNIQSETEKYIWEYRMQNLNDYIIELDWLPDNQYCLFLKDEGLFKLNISTGVVTQLKQSCNNKHIVSMDVSDSGKFILYTKRIRRVINNTTIGWMDEIWKMDFNGCNEERILPQ